MRKLREIGIAVVLAFALSSPAVAGIIPTVPEAPSSSLATSVAVILLQIIVP